MNSERPLRVAMIGQKGFPPVQGGIERHVAELAARLPGLGVEVDIYSRPHYSTLHGATNLFGVRVLRLPSIATKHLDAISHSFLATCDALVRRPDIIHYHALGPGLLSGIPRFVGGIPTVVTVHGLDWQRGKWGRFARGVLKVGEACAVKFPIATIAVSRSLAEYFRVHYGRDIDFIPNGITCRPARPPELICAMGVLPRFVLFVGRLVPEKGCHFLLKAWRELPPDIRKDRELVIAGDSGFTSDYAEGIKRQGVADVRFLGFVHGPVLEELYSNAEVVVLPSTLEGLSIALLEAMSYRRPCLVSDIPPNLEAAGSHAAVFHSGDAHDLALVLADLLADPDRRLKLGTGAGLRVRQEYSWPRVTAQTAAVYRRIAP